MKNSSTKENPKSGQKRKTLSQVPRLITQEAGLKPHKWNNTQVGPSRIPNQGREECRRGELEEKDLNTYPERLLLAGEVGIQHTKTCWKGKEAIANGGQVGVG